MCHQWQVFASRASYQHLQIQRKNAGALVAIQFVMRGAPIMFNVKKVAFVLAAALLVLASRSARADEFDELMNLTFSGPVQLPGVVLPAGAYQFKLANPNTERNLLQILNEDGTQVYATLPTIPEERPAPTYEPAVTFEERGAGSPEAIRAIFYPGATTGREFVYSAGAKSGEVHVAHDTA
jgi:hypothetical protein